MQFIAFADRFGVRPWSSIEQCQIRRTSDTGNAGEDVANCPWREASRSLCRTATARTHRPDVSSGTTARFTCAGDKDNDSTVLPNTTGLARVFRSASRSASFATQPPLSSDAAVTRLAPLFQVLASETSSLCMDRRYFDCVREAVASLDNVMQRLQARQRTSGQLWRRDHLLPHVPSSEDSSGRA